ncbi:hypothetical protein TBLA_0B00260 [Henningerozyma blattae CBS 6284]|uniref:INO80 complex subunit B-like conserved region domain-containing protein n=1 Tax=Henningerozyma blattae (strain ATCC 34711 / CBS 6284 / DSM 70876 / NBRC 10599 / NRRL Y-10934 / UCD 77-7) TaxID=1071380 RepID=I2GXL9_HENB6|nr:hypothetical protein TBLA_0B00260 [Tetrapisispora blattae CBS 6284]CCH58871.1 hypothetical protein TBLA_0B00260 [Tetrapisispora blattae CBS 6284]
MESEKEWIESDEDSGSSKDEEYVETPTNFKSKSKSSTKNKSRLASKKRSRLEADTEDDELIVSPSRRVTVSRIVEDDEEEEDHDEEVEEEADIDELVQEEEDEVEVPELRESDDNGTGEDEKQEDIVVHSEPITEADDVKESTVESLSAHHSRSRMLLDILDDGSNKKQLTEEEIQLRRAENARKRKNLSEKRLEEEKQDTINKLLKKRAGKSRSHLPKDDDSSSKGDGKSANDGNSYHDEDSSFKKFRRPYKTDGMIRIIKIKMSIYFVVLILLQ